MDPTNTTLVPYIIYFYFLSLKEGKTHQLPRVQFSPEVDRKLCRERFCWKNEFFVWKCPFSQTPKCSDCRRHMTNDNREMIEILKGELEHITPSTRLGPTGNIVSASTSVIKRTQDAPLDAPYPFFYDVIC